jgi:hypothetical protein
MAFLHQRDMPRNVGLFTVEGRNNFADALFPLSKQFQYLQPGGLGKGLYDVGLQFENHFLHKSLHEYMII